ncbi:hypothetical protein U6G28_02610 [Actinomycetaceae bacterium MB13-C1-2]|nr:hypothetical protein U6G28_02610 [Actinomycetaceae bacterium MB13-C1-2]
MAAPDILDATTPLTGQWWLKAAQAAIRRFCGWHVAPILSETLRVDAYGGRVLELPSKHVTKLESVMVGGVDWLDRLDWSEAGTLQLKRGRGHWPDAPGAVEVTLEHGWSAEDVPEVAALIVTIGKRARTQPGVVSSQSVNGASVSYQTAGGAPLSVPLLGIEKEMLEPYRVNWGPR